MAIPNHVKLAAVKAAYAEAGNWVAVFTAAAGTSGANEAVGGGHYARAQTAYTDGVNSATSSTTTVPVDAGDFEEAGVFSAQTGGVFGGSGPFAGGAVSVSGVNASIDVTLTWS